MNNTNLVDISPPTSIFLLTLSEYAVNIYTMVTLVTAIFSGILVQYVTPPSLPECPLIKACHKNVCESE